MSKNKQTSDNEKEKKLLEVFHEYQEFYHIKDLEKLVKNVGISQKQVSIVLKRLVERNLVKSKKIGPSIYYWSFPEELVVNKDQQKNNLKEEMKALDVKLVTLEEALQVNNQLLFSPSLKLIQHAHRKRRKMEKMGWNVTSFSILLLS